MNTTFSDILVKFRSKLLPEAQLTPKGELIGTPCEIARKFRRMVKESDKWERERQKYRHDRFRVEEILDARGIGSCNSIEYATEWQRQEKRAISGGFDHQIDPLYEQSVQPQMREILTSELYQAEKQRRLEFIQKEIRAWKGPICHYSEQRSTKNYALDTGLHRE